eukprot:2882469-Pleurochrysis_carterae.AAC.4
MHAPPPFPGGQCSSLLACAALFKVGTCSTFLSLGYSFLGYCAHSLPCVGGYAACVYSWPVVGHNFTSGSLCEDISISA